MARRFGDEDRRVCKHFVHPRADRDELVFSIARELRGNLEVEVYLTGEHLVSEQGALLKDYIVARLDERVGAHRLKAKYLHHLTFI